MAEKSVDIQFEDGQYVVTLDRAHKRNAFDQEMISCLTRAFQEAAINADARVMLLQANGKSFSAGADLQWMQSMVNFSFEENKKDSKKLREMFLALQEVPYPVIARVQGHVMGGALGLVACSDIVAAESKTLFCFSEVKLGLSPAVVSEFVAPKIPRSQLTRLFLTADLFDAEEARSLGLVHFSGSQEDVVAYTEAALDKIMSNGPHAVRATKKLLDVLYGSNGNFADYSTELIAKLRASSEGQDGLAAFFSKRPPKWRNP